MYSGLLLLRFFSLFLCFTPISSSITKTLADAKSSAKRSDSVAELGSGSHGVRYVDMEMHGSGAPNYRCRNMKIT